MDWEKHFRAMKKPQTSFGAEARGTAEAGTGGAVIPPGRYWLDVFGPKITVFQAWLASKPEVSVETVQEDTSGGTIRTFYIFTIPKTANNYGIPGDWFPTVALGFPEVADSTVQSSDDTVQKPPPPTPGDVLADAASSTGGFLASIDTKTLLKYAVVAGVVILVATLPGTLIKAAT